MKTPIPRANPLDQRMANLERVVAALVELASPEQLRKAIATVTSRQALLDLGAAVEAGALYHAAEVGPLTIAVRFREMRGDEVVTAQVVAQLGGMGEEDRAKFIGKRIGDVVSETNGARAILDQVWDRTAPPRSHRPKGHRHGHR